jgi:hypothetical protein
MRVAPRQEKSCKARATNDLNTKFPQIPAAFPAVAGKSADFGPNLHNLPVEAKKSLQISLVQGFFAGFNSLQFPQFCNLQRFGHETLCA